MEITKKIYLETLKSVLVRSILHYLGPLLFLLYINNLQFASDLLDAIMFADDTHLFYSNKDVNAAFLKVNDELQKVNELFISNKSIRRNPKLENTHKMH